MFKTHFNSRHLKLNKFLFFIQTFSGQIGCLLSTAAITTTARGTVL